MAWDNRIYVKKAETKMNRFVIIIEFTPNDLRFQMFDEDLPAIYPSIATAREGARGAIWENLNWWIVAIDQEKVISG